MISGSWLSRVSFRFGDVSSLWWWAAPSHNIAQWAPCCQMIRQTCMCVCVLSMVCLTAVSNNNTCQSQWISLLTGRVFCLSGPFNIVGVLIGDLPEGAGKVSLTYLRKTLTFSDRKSAFTFCRVCGCLRFVTASSHGLLWRRDDQGQTGGWLSFVSHMLCFNCILPFLGIATKEAKKPLIHRDVQGIIT